MMCLVVLAVGVSDAAFAQASPPSCQAERARFAVGARYSDELGRRALRRARAAVLRVTRPGQVYTMEFRADRLNVDLDHRPRVRAVRCG
jgi:hypothetical protein